MERQGHGGPVDLHRRWSKVVSSIYCRLRRSDSHPECNLTPRRSDLHGLRVRFKSFNYSAVRWHFKFGLSFVLFAATFLSFLSFCRPHEAPSVAPPQRNYDDRRVVVFSFPGLWKCLSECCLWKNDSIKINICAFAFLVNKCNSSSTEANLSEMLATVIFFVCFLFPFSPCSGKEVVWKEKMCTSSNYSGRRCQTPGQRQAKVPFSCNLTAYFTRNYDDIL